MPKKDEPGFIEVCCPDGRRGLWFRQTPSPNDVGYPQPETIELAAGRPGDESLFTLKPGHVVTEKDVHDLQSLMLTVKFAFDMVLEKPKADLWMQGVAVALAVVYQNTHNDSTIEHALTGMGITVDALRAGGATEYDLKKIEKALKR